MTQTQTVGYRVVTITKDRMNEPERLVTGMVSTVDPDEIGDVMMPQGVDTSYLDQHKSVNLYHDPKKPIGSHRWHKVKPNGILVQFKVGTHPLGQEAWTMIQEQVVNALSIEFEGMQFGPPTSEESKRFGDDARRVYRRWKLRGYGVVSQPMNAGALITEAKARVNEFLSRRVSQGKCSIETAVALGMEVEPTRKVILGESGLTWRAM